MIALGTLRRRPSATGWLGLAGISCWLIGFGVAANAADPSFPVLLTGSGDGDVNAELVDWQNSLLEAEQPVDVQYFQRGTKDGRDSLLRGTADFTISGVPFTAAELASRPAGAGEIIDLPIALTALSVVSTTPIGGGWQTYIPPPASANCESDDPDPILCLPQIGQYTGPIRLPASPLSSVMLRLPPEFERNGFALWSAPDTVAAFGTATLGIMDGLARPIFVNRTEGAAQNVAIQTYGKAMAPTVWAMKQREDASHDWEALSEQLSPKMLTRYGLDTAVGITAIYGTPPGGGSQSADWAANMTVLPSTQVARLLEDFPLAKFREVEVQNRHGDWVLPTTETISAAFAAGTSPSIAATNDVPVGYPLTYLTKLYTVAGTLTPDEANALAAMVRYVATDGQDLVLDDGGAPLTAAMRAQALAAADEIVTKNCAIGNRAATYHVITSGPSAMEPDTPKVQALTNLRHCELKPVPTTTTEPEPEPTTTQPTATTQPAATTATAAAASTTASTTTSIVASLPAVPQPPTVFAPSVVVPIPFDSENSSADPSSEADSSTESASTTTSPNVEEAESVATETTQPTVGAASPRVRGRTLDQLPLPKPSDGSEGFKKLGTLMIGAASFLFGRRVVQSRRRVA
jgi:hypothetical protein